MYQPGLMGLC